MSFSVPDDALNNRVVLIAEDHPDALDVLSMLFEWYGATVVRSRNGKEALELTLEHKPDFILTDINMPIMSGWEFIEKLRQNPAVAHIPVVVISAHSSPEDHLSPTAKNFRNYIPKPYLPEQIVGQVLMLIKDDLREFATLLQG